MKDDKYKLWKVLHPQEFHCHYCRKSTTLPGCPLLVKGVVTRYKDIDYKNCREFLKPENYRVPDVMPRLGDAGIFYTPYIPVQIIKK
ncbi:MAG: hypothetical protein WC495_07025 [Patescibacteria group bacterium]|jgi:hypothetical protein